MTEKKATLTEKTETTASATKKKTSKAENYLWAIGRRKTARAIVRLYPGKKEMSFNQKTLADYFPVLEFQQLVQEPLKLTDQLGKVGLEVILKGGGMRGQAEAARLAIARALVKLNQEFKKTLRARGLLTRDARVKERKKPGLKKARRAPQWGKR